MRQGAFHPCAAPSPRQPHLAAGLAWETDQPAPPQGDSGGPLICDGILQGVDSFVIRGCATGQYPDFFPRVSLYVDWIHTVLSSIGGEDSP